MVSQFMLEWHGNRSSLGRSFLMYTEDMDAQRFTELAQWLGQPCTFNSAPNANEYDPTLGGALVGSPYFHHSKARLSLTPTLSPIPQPGPTSNPNPNPNPITLNLTQTLTRTDRRGRLVRQARHRPGRQGVGQGGRGRAQATLTASN